MPEWKSMVFHSKLSVRRMHTDPPAADLPNWNQFQKALNRREMQELALLVNSAAGCSWEGGAFPSQSQPGPVQWQNQLFPLPAAVKLGDKTWKVSNYLYVSPLLVLAHFWHVWMIFTSIDVHLPLLPSLFVWVLLGRIVVNVTLYLFTVCLLDLNGLH